MSQARHSVAQRTTEPVEDRGPKQERSRHFVLILSVPSDRFEDALDELRGLGEEVATDTVSGQDVTEEYVDSQSCERKLLAADQSLLDL